MYVHLSFTLTNKLDSLSVLEMAGFINHTLSLDEAWSEEIFLVQREKGFVEALWSEMGGLQLQHY